MATKRTDKNRAEGEERTQEKKDALYIIHQGVYYKILPEELKKYAMSDEEVEALIKASGSEAERQQKVAQEQAARQQPGGYPTAFARPTPTQNYAPPPMYSWPTMPGFYPTPTAFARPTPGSFSGPMPANFSAPAPTAFARPTPTAFARPTPTAFARPTPTYIDPAFVPPVVFPGPR
ncbi:hypothetical protein [Marinimicrobium agarilyticum]|uniref:hypothetical protein n=1 Tax=Marinimicrobium agarilyticum TaxID=306546 RepID=UPI00047FF9B0|nr:hypothetical protein [Marinimicrobium agarilyticum]